MSDICMEYDIYLSILSNCCLLRVTCVFAVVFVQNFKKLIKFDNQNIKYEKKKENHDKSMSLSPQKRHGLQFSHITHDKILLPYLSFYTNICNGMVRWIELFSLLNLILSIVPFIYSHCIYMCVYGIKNFIRYIMQNPSFPK